LTGCAEWQSVAVAGHDHALKIAQNANDDALAVETEGLCATPYSALQRNATKRPALKTAVRALCGDIPDAAVVTLPTAAAAPTAPTAPAAP
jgi:hypothetical protein